MITGCLRISKESIFRSDLFIKSVSRRGIAIVVEFKIANDIDDLEKKVDEAIEQI